MTTDTIIRTDIHRPSAIIPEDYDYVSCDYYGQYAELWMGAERQAFRAHMERTGGRYSNHEHGGTCHICGAHAMWVAKFWHRDTNTYIVTGMDCAAKMDMGDAVAFRSAKKRVAAGRKLMRGKAKAQEILTARGLDAAWAIYTATDCSAHEREENIVADIVGKVVQYGSVSDRQADFLAKLVNVDIPQRAARKAARAEQNARSEHVGTVGERRDFDLTVRFVTSVETRFGVMWITSMTDADDNIVIYKGQSLGVERGATVKMAATVKEHGEYKGAKQTIVARPKVR